MAANPAEAAGHPSAMKVLAISGSLRVQSTNTTLLHAIALIAAPEIGVVFYDELHAIPAFNPDLDVEPGPDSVERFRAQLREAGAVLFSTPEYAHGVPGSLKNILDWVVGSGELSGKPVVLVNASARGEYAQASLREILKTMDARLIPEAEVTIPLMGKGLDARAIAADVEFAAVLRSSLGKLRIAAKP
jgi:NAD(P)H-dependent FMN reductase